MQRGDMPSSTPPSPHGLSARYSPCAARHTPLLRLATVVLLAVALGGCVSSGVDQARRQFYAGRLSEAGESLAELDDDDGKDRVLLLMERGMIKHTDGDHASAVRDWLDAITRIQQLDYVSLSEKTASMVINDRTETYTGRPYERALLHAFIAKSYFAK